MTTIALLLASLGTGDLREDAEKALRKAVTFYSTKVTSHGGYVYRYSEDLTRSEGENKTSRTTAWLEPPGTPAVGLAYLEAHAATDDRFYLDAAVKTARALVQGQLRSGGWAHLIEFDEKDRRRYAFRTSPAGKKQRNWTTLDDNKTQSALLFMMRVDRALDFKDEKIHEATRYALDALLKAQFPNGGFPHAFRGPAEAKPAQHASYPDSWSRSMPRNHDYWVFPTLNDNLLGDLTPVLFEAARIYRDDRFQKAARRVGNFLVGAQMPDPQPAWAQQYDFEMHPTWARKFEPPSITGGESRDAIKALMEIARETGDRKYLGPIPRALDYLQRSRLRDGKLARFYELKTNKPLYFTKDYTLTYSDKDMPTHYGFKISDWTKRVDRDFEKVKAGELRPRGPKKIDKPSEKSVRRVIEAMDKRGAWVEKGRLKTHRWEGRVIESSTFIRNVGTLSRYLAATR